ncbi:MAG: hypothetical protein NVSMB48_11960 [Marmoricola sp.]
MADCRLTAVVADDDVDVRPLIALTLRRAGFAVEICENGTDAWAAIRRIRPAVAVLDLTMPGLSGLEVIAQIRADASLESCRTLLLTGHAAEGGRDLNGADDYLVKPFSPRELVARVEQLTQRD